MAEPLCAVYNSRDGLDVKIARCFAFVGPYLPLESHFAIGNFILDRVRRETVSVHGDGTPLRSYLYAADLMIRLLRILCRGGARRPYNVGSEEAVSIAEVAKKVAECGGNAQRVRIERESSGNESRLRYVPRVSRASDELALERFISLTSAIEKTVAWNA